MKDGKADQSNDSLGGSAGDSKEKWITIDRLCDAYEASLQEGEVERAPFLAGVPAGWRGELVRELDAIDAAYRDSEETHEDTHASSLGPRSRVRKEVGAGPVGLPKLESKSVWLGRFEIHKRLGSGATGSVWSARDARLARWVALKVPHASRAMSETTASRFQTEARAAAAITHPNVVQVHEVLLEDGLPILVQQWIDGPSLAAYLKEHGHLDFDLAADWMIQIADAVACAHGNGIVHRDLKPANVMIRKKHPMVLDFGLASYPEFSSGLTTEGTVLGTPAYMSPEQADGFHTEAKPTTDVYSMGVILYEMLVGSPPFVGKTKEVLHAVKMTMPASPRSRRAGIPRDLETIVMRCLRKSPGARYSTAADLRDDLKRFRNREPIEARQIGPIQYAWSWCNVRPVRSLAIAALIMISWLAVSVLVSWHDQGQLTERAERLESVQALNERMRRELVKQQYTMQLAHASQEMASGHRLRGKELLEEIPATLRDWEWRLLDGLSSSPSTILDPSESDESIDGAITSIAATNRQRRLIAATDNGRILAWTANKPAAKAKAAKNDSGAENAPGDQATSDPLDSVFGDPVTLHQAPAPINTIAVSPDERFLAWAESEGDIVLWDLKKDTLLCRIRHPSERPCYAIDFALDSKTLVAGGPVFPGCKDLEQRISWLECYTVGGRRGLKHLSGHAWYNREPITSVQFASADQFFLTRSGRETRQVGMVEKWSIGETKAKQWGTLAEGFGHRGLDFHPEEKCISWCDGAGVVTVYNVVENAIVCRQRVSERPLLVSRFSHDGTEIAVVSEDLVLSRWKVTTTQGIDPEPEKKEQGTQPSTEDLSLATTDAVKPPSASKPTPTPMQLRRIDAATLIREYSGHDQQVNDIAFLPAGMVEDPIIVSSSDDGTIRVWSEKLSQQVEQVRLRQRGVTDATWIAPDKVAVITTARPYRKILKHRQREFTKHGVLVDHWHLRRPLSIVPLPEPLAATPEVPSLEKPLDSLASKATADKPQQSSFLIHSRDGFKLIHPDGPSVELESAIAPVHFKHATAVCALGSQWIAYATTGPAELFAEALTSEPSEADSTAGKKKQPKLEITLLHLFNLAESRLVDSIVLKNAGRIGQLRLSQSGHALVAGLDNGDGLWMTVSEECHGRASLIDAPAIIWDAGHRKINDVQWLGSSDRFATVGSEGRCAIWSFDGALLDTSKACSKSNTTSPVLEHRLRVSSGPVTHVHSSPSGNRIATVGADRVIRIWDTDSGLELLSLRPRNTQVRAVEFSPDERFLLIAESDSRLELIEL